MYASGVSKFFARRATCGEMNICGAAFDYNTGHELCSIHFMNQVLRAGQNLIKGRVWPAGQTLDMPGIHVLKRPFHLNLVLHTSTKTEAKAVKGNQLYKDALASRQQQL